MHRLLPLFLALLLPALTRSEQVLWDAARQLGPAAAPHWQPKTTGTLLPAQGRADGLCLPCPRKPGADRVVWETAASFPCLNPACLELEFLCDRPEAVEKIMLYLGQGKGWRVAAWGNLHRGWNRVVLPLSLFQSEGASAPGPCDRLRIALVPTGLADGIVRLDSLRVTLPDVAVVNAAAAAIPVADRANSLRTANLIHDWLSDAGIGHAFVNDQGLSAGLSPTLRALILPAHPKVTPAVLQLARDVVGRGGRVLVCGGEDAELAALLRMQRQTAKETTAFGTYASIALAGTDGKPLVIHDHNWRIAPVKPLPGAGKVTALWQDARGKNLYEPALVATDRGWWFAFPFHAGDQRRKQDLLVKMLGEACPAVWAEAARTRLARALRAGPWVGVSELRHIAARSAGNRAAAAGVLLNQAEQMESAARETLGRGLHAHAYSAAGRLEARLDNAYALTQPPGPARELRGVWDHNGVGLYPGGWDATCAILADAGFNAVFPNLMWSGKAHFRSRTLPASKTCEQFGDQLGACTEAAKKHGLQVHVWKVCWQLGGTDSPLYEAFRKAGRLQVGAGGETQPWLCPSQLENVNWEVSALTEVARHPGIAGIHLDYVRYPEGGGCYCDRTREAFERTTGRTVANWPRDVGPGGVDAKAFARFRADEITRFVGRVQASVRAVNPKLKLSAAVFGKYPQCVDSVAQDWGRWLREGTVDFVTPMNYTADAHQFAGWLRDQTALEEDAAGKIMPGIGAISTECELAPDQILQQIAEARRLNLPGYVLFKLDQVLIDRALPYLKLAQ